MKKYFVVVAVIIVIISLSSFLIHAEDDKVKELTGMRFVQLARGGLLYDNWPVALGIKIDRTHPSYPKEGRQKGQETWRCKECHGWDYKGKAGAYGRGKHYTGIVGIRSYANQDAVEIVKVLKNDVHAFGNMLSENDYDALALFVSLGQIDVDLYIDRKTRKAKGNIANGSRIYLVTCTKCHGSDGKAINLGDENRPVYIGTIANENPWETLHKIRWGHPGAPMISLLFLDLKEQLDVLAFCQSLPRE